MLDPIAYRQEFAQSLKKNAANVFDSQLNQANKGANEDTLISKVDAQITDLENIVSKMNLTKQQESTYTIIKSLNNGQEFNLLNQVYKDDVTGNEKQGYQVSFNNGCLGIGQNDYDIYKCDPSDKKQIFNMVNISNNVTYSNNIDKLLPYVIADNTNTQYPFNLIKSYNNDNCLTNNHGQITVQPCSTSVSQRWIPVDESSS